MASTTHTSLSIVIVAKNEATNIREFFPSWQFADEIIIVVDAASTDDTASVAKELGAKVTVQPWLGFAAQKNFALRQATGDWILALDADEQPTPAAQTEIRQAISSQQFDSYELPWQAYFLGRPVRHSGWYPGWQLRLFRRGTTDFGSNEIHEKVQPTGRVGRLPTAIVNHYTYRSLASYFEKLGRYTTLEAQDKAQRRGLTTLKQLIKPVYHFIDMYLIKLGFLDGWTGLQLASLSAYYDWVVFRKLLARP